MLDQETIDGISRKLDVIIGLLLDLRTKQSSEKETILALKASGMRVDEIARALGKSANSVYLTVSRSKR